MPKQYVVKHSWTEHYSQEHIVIADSKEEAEEIVSLKVENDEIDRSAGCEGSYDEEISAIRELDLPGSPYTYEVCPHCMTENKIHPRKVGECQVCKAKIRPCSCCPGDNCDWSQDQGCTPFPSEKAKSEAPQRKVCYQCSFIEAESYFDKEAFCTRHEKEVDAVSEVCKDFEEV